MGASSSTAFTELTLEDASDLTAAETPVKVRAVMPDFDPRSPCPEICRTPIIVERTPDDPLENAPVSSVPLLHDPRSPTAGIPRTPICMLSGQRAKSESALDSSLLDEQGSPYSVSSHGSAGEDAVSPISDIDVHCTWDDLPGKMNRSLSDPELNLHWDEQESLEQADVKARLSFTRLSTPTKAEISDENCDVPRARQLLKSSGGEQRSPLSTRNVDMNSPRMMVQMKQTSRLAASKQTTALRARNSAKYQQLTEDKENC